MYSEIVIRPVEPADFTSWKALWEEFNSYFDRAVAHEVTDRTWNRFFESNARIFATVAEKRGELIGFAHFVFHLNSDMPGDTCYLQDLFTREEERGQGIGRALVAEIMEQARRQGASTLYFQAAEGNRLATELFDRIAERADTCIYRLRVRKPNPQRPSVAAAAA